jgi:YfiH family protein
MSHGIKSDASANRAFSRDHGETAMPDDNVRFAAATAAAAEPPAANPPFRWTRETWGHALRAAPLECYAQHLFTSSQLRLPAHAGASAREEAWQAIAASLHAERGRLLRVRQVHGREVRVVAAADPVPDPSSLPDGDAIVSNRAGAVLAVVVADCVPLLLADPRLGAAAAVHAGWRGTCAGVTGAAVAAMRQTWGSSPDDLVAAMGPSIGPDDYEVGETLIDAFRDAGHGASVDRWFSRRDGTLRLDLWRANVEQLEAAGVRPDRVFTAGLSTAVHPSWLESYRRDGAAAGRLVAAIVVPRPATDQGAF